MIFTQYSSHPKSVNILLHLAKGTLQMWLTLRNLRRIIHVHVACAPQQERPLQWEACALQQSSRPLTATGESPKQRRASAAKNRISKLNLKLSKIFFKIDQIWVYTVYLHSVHGVQRILLSLGANVILYKSLPHAKPQRKPKDSKSRYTMGPQHWPWCNKNVQ